MAVFCIKLITKGDWNFSGIVLKMVKSEIKIILFCESLQTFYTFSLASLKRL